MPYDHVFYYHEVALDMVLLNGDPVLHVVDTRTTFHNTSFVTYKSVEGLCRSLTECWSTF